jgi:aspartate aminotransferase
MWQADVRPVEKSQTLLLNEQQRQQETAGQEVFKFGFGQSPFPPLEAAIEALRAHAAAKDYTPVQGWPELRERVAAFHREVDALEADAAQVLIAPGSKILIYAVMAAFARADVLIAAPAWVSYAPQARLLGHDVLRVHTELAQRWRVRPGAVEEAVRRKADGTAPTLMILNHPGNPDGQGYDEDELRALAEVCRRHRILVVSDEIYGLLHHQGRHVSLARHYPEGSIVTSGLSKWCGAGGWRLGTALLPAALRGPFQDALLGVASETYSCAAMPVQRAACVAYTWNDDTRDYLAHQRRLLARVGTWLADHLTAAGVQVHRPEGGFYLFPDFSLHVDALRRAGIGSSQALCARLMADTGVALLPGDAFGLPPEHLAARLAYVEFDGREALKVSREIGLSRPLDEGAFAAVFDKTIRGARRLTQWLAAL